MSREYCELTSYSELADVLVRLPLLLREARRARRLSTRAAAERIGISFSTLTRIESNHGFQVDNALTVIQWLAEPATKEGAE